MSKYGVISGPYFPVFGLNTEFYSVNLRIQSEYRKIQTRNNPLFGHFSRSDIVFRFYYHVRALVIEVVVRRCSVKNVFLEISKNSQENNCARVSFLISWLRTLFYIEHLWWLLLWLVGSCIFIYLFWTIRIYLPKLHKSRNNHPTSQISNTISPYFFQASMT